MFTDDALGDHAAILHDYYQDFKATSCSQGLLHDVDKLVFNTSINLSMFDKGVKLLAYEIGTWKGHGFQTVCFMKIPKDCQGFEATDCYCESTAHKDVYNMILNTTARKDYHKLRVLTSYEDFTATYTDERAIPKTADPGDVSTTLVINNQTVDKANCTISVDVHQVNVRYKCTVHSPSPCHLEAIDVLKNKTLDRGHDAIDFTLQYTETPNLQFLLKKRICNSSKIESVYCNIKTVIDLTSRRDEGSLSNVIIVITALLVIVCVFSIITVLFFVVRKMKLKRSKQELARKIETDKAEEKEFL
ncbi:hypothetical protein Btru_039102 [Bulinus truncatus]|nr:hypothetical protein Btru_039102 [Bulinus truncatus]